MFPRCPPLAVLAIRNDFLLHHGLPNQTLDSMGKTHPCSPPLSTKGSADLEAGHWNTSGTVVNQQERDRRQAYLGRLCQLGAEPDRARLMRAVCLSCHLVRPERSKHCSVCNKCVARFDHHCHFVGNCVGAGNYRAFFLYIWSTSLAGVLYLVQGVGLLISQGLQDYVGTLVCIVHAGFMSVFVVSLAAGHTYFVTQNITTNENLNSGRYDHFGSSHSGSGEGGFRNPFDKGCYSNWRNWWRSYPRHRPGWLAAEPLPV